MHTAKRIKTEGMDYSMGRPFPGQRESNVGPNHILLITVINPAYPITCDVIHTICQPHGKVHRIVIFKKNGIQAMVEFDNIDAAKRAKSSLHGCDIYSGCCTLRIEFAKPTRLNVYKNDSESFDYTNPQLVSMKPDEMRPTLLGGDPSRMGPGMGGGYNGPPGPTADAHGGYDGYPAPAAGVPRGPGNFGMDPYNQAGSPYNAGPNGPVGNDGRALIAPGGPNSGPPPPGPQQGAVMMVYGLNHEKTNSDRLFNLFCLYGNVVRVKFLKSKEGCAMVQMGDTVSVQRAVEALNNASFFGTKLQLGYSKQAFLNDVPQPFNLPDETPSFKDYMGNRNNRFTNPEAASKNRISPPSKVLHFFNAPPGLNEDDVSAIFKQNGAPVPSTIRFFPSKTDRSSSGLVQFESISDALEALILCNHVNINNPNGKFPFILKLCFSSAQPRTNQPGGAPPPY